MLRTITLFVFFIFLNSCGFLKVKSGNYLKDKRDGQIYSCTKLADGNYWMTENLNYVVKRSWKYKDTEDKYGRLYTWQAAQNSCPDGWTLPSDDEWWNMIAEYGETINIFSGKPTSSNSVTNEKTYEILVGDGDSGFEASLGGKRNSKSVFYYQDTLGGYWTSTKSVHWKTGNSKNSAISYIFYSDKQMVGRIVSDKDVGCSVRCIKE